ncbi:hypothetical protein KTF22_18515 [Burkholderia multivorans]|uniref:hypothetical protein n=1 Tax=Burkholderia multivorans TaxID=87883 RepID=UPI001C24C694|nr:hypothetical protein [Burkholderia multivorans]MBU9663871.1 hypothetical protein [Burkholderia multivorans]
MTSISADRVERVAHVANCPHCAQPHHYVEVGFPVANDRGHWEVECSQCKGIFIIELSNPRESGGDIRRKIKAVHEEPFIGDQSVVARDVLRHNIDLNRNSWSFNYAAAPLYRCAKDSSNLEGLAKETLKAGIDGVLAAYGAALNYLLKGGEEHDIALARVPLACSCGGKHTATFYTRLAMGGEAGPRSEDDFLLADVSGSMMEETLDGIVSKDDAMDFLEKLIIRWNLLAEQILIVSPFVGTTYMSDEKQLAIWSWLLGMLNAEKSVFLTRGATYTAYKKAMETDGIPVDLLEKFGLENKIVAMDVRKQDFHAKFFAAVSERGCEVMSGSANLVRGPSVENIGFRVMERAKFDQRYLERMNLKKPLPTPKAASRHWVLIDKGPKGWRSRPMLDSPYIDGPKPRRPPENAPVVGPGHPVSVDAAKCILDNAVDFLNGGLELLFAGDLSSQTAKVAVISIQTSIELLAKYRMVQEEGLQSIIRGKLPSKNLERAVKECNFSTLGFGEVLDLVDAIEGLRDDEKSLINELVGLRNDLVHFSSEIDPESVKLNCVHILARVLSMFALGEARDVGEMEDYRRFLSEPNFQELINFEPYRAETVDAAHESLDGEKVLKCYLCGNESFCLRVSENYFCHCCGFRVVSDAIAFATCDVCGSEEGVFFDPLNTTNNMHYGKCMDCEIYQWAWECPDCGSVISQLEGKARRACPTC